MRLLFAEDDELLRETILADLEDAGYAVTAAANGAEALQALDQNRFDLLVTDIMMPVMDGLELILAVRGRKLDLRILAISGGGAGRLDSSSYGTDVLRVAERFGADAVLAKPFLPSQLIAAIEKLRTATPGAAL